MLKDAEQSGFVLTVLNLSNRSQQVVERSSESQLNPRWNHAGTRIAYTTAALGGRLTQLRIVDLERNESRSLGEPMEGLTGVSWSADDSLLAYTARVDGQRVLGVISIASAKVQQIGVLAAEGSYDWAPAGRKLSYVPGDAPTSIRVLDIDRLSSDVSIRSDGELSILEWSSDGASVFAAARKITADFPTLVQFSLASSAVQELPVAIEGEVTELRAVGSRLAFSEQRNGSRSLFLYQPTRGKQRVSGEFAWSVGGAEHPDRLYVIESTKLGMELELKEIDLTTNSSRSLHRLSPGARAGISMTMVTPPVAPERSTNAIYWQPLGAQSARRSVLIMIHGGPKLSYLPSWRPELNVLLRNEIDVLQLNYHGSSGYGAKYAAGLAHAVSDAVATVEYAEKTLGYRRGDIYLLGDSFGAGLALEAFGTLTEPIGGLILFSYLGNVQGNGVKPANVLVFHGENDPVVNPERALQALKRHWKIADRSEGKWWKIVRGEGHSFRAIEAWATVLDTVIRFIKPEASERNVSESR